MQLPGLSIRSVMFRIVRLFPVGVPIVVGHSTMLWPIDWNKFPWLSDFGELQGYCLSLVKREMQGSSVSGNAQLW